jgi:hypothetical protein
LTQVAEHAMIGGRPGPRSPQVVVEVIGAGSDRAYAVTSDYIAKPTTPRTVHLHLSLSICSLGQDRASTPPSVVGS